MSTRAQVLQRVRELRARKLSATHLTSVDKDLLGRLTTLHDYRAPYSGTPRGELFIHWFYRDRTEDRLSRCEIFHLNMLRRFDVPHRVATIHVRCASEHGLSRAMEQAKEILSDGTATLDFQVVKPKRSWEHDTFRECVEYAVSSGKFVYYTHFKGASRMADPSLGIDGRVLHNSTDLDLLYWGYLMYVALFEAPPDVKAVGPLLHLGMNASYRNRDKSWSQLCKGNQVFHYCGSFQAFSGDYIRDCLEACGMGDYSVRNTRLWVNDPYTVEMFLSMVALKKDVYTLNTPDSFLKCPAYQMYRRKALPWYMHRFQDLYLEDSNAICVANGTYRWIGGTDTFNWAMCRALKELGYDVYYYAPDMDGTGVTEKYLREIGVKPYMDGTPLRACFANQQTGKHFLGICPVVQTCHSAYTTLEYPVPGVRAYVSISEEIRDFLKTRGVSSELIRNGIDLERYSCRNPLRETPVVLSICQGDDALLREACETLGWAFKSVPKEVGSRVWHIEDLINGADLVVGIGRSLYDAMACGRACVSWDNRPLNPYTGCGYVTAERWHDYARTNFTGRGYPRIDTVDGLVEELRKYRPMDGATMRGFAERELDMRRNVLKYLELAGINIRKK